MDRRYQVGILALLTLGAILFAISQNQKTQSMLVAAQVTVTAQFNALIEQSTAASGTQVAAATQAADAQSKAVNDAQSAAATALSAAVSQAQNDAATAQSQALTQAHDDAATAQAQAQNTAIAAQNEAVRNAYDEAATPYLATQTKLQNDAATAQSGAAATQSALADALATAQAQLTEVAQSSSGTPSDAAKAYFNAALLGQGDANSLVCSTIPAETKKAMQDGFDTMRTTFDSTGATLDISGLTFTEHDVSGDTAQVDVEGNLKVTVAGTSQDAPYPKVTIPMKNEGGTWKVCS